MDIKQERSCFQKILKVCPSLICGLAFSRKLLATSASEPVFNEVAMGQLQAMGFPEIRCKKALLATGNTDPEAAMEWLFAHMDDPGE